jgi:hypothetical protein
MSGKSFITHIPHPTKVKLKVRGFGWGASHFFESIPWKGIAIQTKPAVAARLGRLCSYSPSILCYGGLKKLGCSRLDESKFSIILLMD